MPKDTKTKRQGTIESALIGLSEAFALRQKAENTARISHLLTHCQEYNPKAYQGAHTALVERNDPDEFRLWASQSNFLGGTRVPFIQAWIEKRFLNKGKELSSKQLNQLTHLYSNAAFLESTLSELFTKVEGSACSADKSKTVMRRWASFCEGEIASIEWDYEGQYTYHLPKKIFTTHESIAEFFDATERLLLGRPLPFAALIASELSKATPA